jgi:catalase-peroxidase
MSPSHPTLTLTRLIYVNPEGPGGVPDMELASRDIRETFARMAMDDEETVALIAGGHTFGKAHGAGDPGPHVGPEPEGAAVADQGFGWSNSLGSGKGVDTISSGLEGAWTTNPIAWDMGYFENLFKYEWEQTTSPAGATQWTPTDASAAGTVPDAHDGSKSHAPMMFTTDLALRTDPSYLAISQRFAKDEGAFKEAFAKAWYKLTHRDMGPRARCLGTHVPPVQLWQDPVPEASGVTISVTEIAQLKREILQAGISLPELVRVAWASASTYRCTDHRGGANGARIRLAPQKDWEVNRPSELAEVLDMYGKVQAAFNGKGGNQVSMADLIVLGGCAAVEEAAKAAGDRWPTVPFSPGRTDASLEQTDVPSFDVLEPVADGFRNHFGPRAQDLGAPEHLLIDRAHMLGLTAPEMAVLVAGLRVLDAGSSPTGVLTDTPGQLSNDFFVNLLDMDTVWAASSVTPYLYEGKDAHTGELKWKASQVDLSFGSNSQLRAIAEYYACDDAKAAFVDDFAAAWAKVMNSDRFDL